MGGIFLCHSLREAPQTAALCTLNTCYLYHNNCSVLGKLRVLIKSRLCTYPFPIRNIITWDQATETRHLPGLQKPSMGFFGTVAPNIPKKILERRVPPRRDTRNAYRSALGHSDTKLSSTEQSRSTSVVGAAEFPQPGARDEHEQCLTAFETGTAGKKAR